MRSASKEAVSLTINILDSDEEGGAGGVSPFTCSECKIHRSEDPISMCVISNTELKENKR